MKKNDSAFKRVNDDLKQDIYKVKQQQDANYFETNKRIRLISMYLLYMLISLFIILAFLFTWVAMHYRKIKRHATKLDELQSANNAIYAITSKLDSLKLPMKVKEIDEMKIALGAFNTKYNDLKSQQDEYKIHYGLMEDVVFKIHQAMKDGSFKGIEFYMGVPVENYFSINSKSYDYNPALQPYRFFQKNGFDEAQFEVISDPETIKFVRSDLMYIFNPACKMLNNATSSTNSVVTVQKGKAIYDNEKYKIIDKAVIRFE
jgi:hypothetical protein